MAQSDDAAGYKKIVIKPYPGGSLKHACATLKTYYGTVVSGWRIHGNKTEMRVEIPVNTKATIYFPTTKGENITEGSKPIELIIGLTILGQEENHTIVQIGSGKYQFIIQKNEVN